MSLLPGGCCGGMKINDLLSSLEGCDVANTCSLYVHSVTLDTVCIMKVSGLILEMHIVWTCKIAHCTLLGWPHRGPFEGEWDPSRNNLIAPGRNTNCQLEKYLLSAIKRNTCFFNIRHRFTYILRFIFDQNLIWKSKREDWGNMLLSHTFYSEGKATLSRSLSVWRAKRTKSRGGPSLTWVFFG